MERVSECLKGIYGTSEPAGGRDSDNVNRGRSHLPPIDLSVHRTRLMKESHDQLLQLCSSADKDFLDLQVPPTKPTKRKKGNFIPPPWPPVSDGHPQVPGESTTSPGSTARNGSYLAQARFQLLPHHKMNLQNRPRFDDEADLIVNYMCHSLVPKVHGRHTGVGGFLPRFLLEGFISFGSYRPYPAGGGDIATRISRVIARKMG